MRHNCDCAAYSELVRAAHQLHPFDDGHRVYRARDYRDRETGVRVDRLTS